MPDHFFSQTSQWDRALHSIQRDNRLCADISIQGIGGSITATTKSAILSIHSLDCMNQTKFTQTNCELCLVFGRNSNQIDETRGERERERKKRKENKPAAE